MQACAWTEEVFFCEASRNARSAFSKSCNVSFTPMPHFKSIRLITFEAGSGELLKGRLDEYPLTFAPPYTALSYTWDSPFSGSWQDEHYSSSLGIQCNGKAMLVKANLYNAIRHCMRPPLNEAREKRYNKTPLIQSAERGDLKSVLEHLQLGADLSAQNCFGETPLHYAAENGHLDVVKALVFAGSRLDQRDDKSRTPVDCAKQRQRRSWQEIEAFLTTCASPTRTSGEDAKSQAVRTTTRHY